MKIKTIHSREILDSRGRPTLSTRITSASGAQAEASVPSGASTGAAEALELRDGDESRYGGLGCLNAVSNVNGEIAKSCEGKEFASIDELDAHLLGLDGTKNKSRLGANAILSVSLAFARTAAIEAEIPLYEYFARWNDKEIVSLPRMTINLFSGGVHASGGVAIQDVLVVPASANSIDVGLANTYAVFQSATKNLKEKYQMRPLRADEGGLAPPSENVRSMLNDAIAAIEGAGLRPGQDIAFAMDVASSHFYRDGSYLIDGKTLNAEQMIDEVSSWLEQAPLVSVEDGLAEEDWDNWKGLKQKLAGRALVLGDDFLCTNPERIQRAIDEDAADALLLKVNQIGSLSEARQALNLAKSAGWRVTVSARSGETEDNWLADLAVGWNADQIKIGSITQSERLAKYNRLLEIESELQLPVISWPKG